MSLERKRAPRAMIVVLGALSVAMCRPRPASAEPMDRAAAVFVAGLSNIVPSELGFDVSTDGAVPRFRLGWSFQLKSCWLIRHHCEGERLENLRLVFAPRLAFGAQTSRDGRYKAATFDLRLGVRYRAPHSSGSRDHRRVPYFGLGSTIETWPYARGSVSAETGVHFGTDEELDPGWTLGVQADAFVSGEPGLRASLLVGWTML